MSKLAHFAGPLWQLSTMFDLSFDDFNDCRWHLTVLHTATFETATREYSALPIVLSQGILVFFRASRTSEHPRHRPHRTCHGHHAATLASNAVLHRTKSAGNRFVRHRPLLYRGRSRHLQCMPRLDIPLARIDFERSSTTDSRLWNTMGVVGHILLEGRDNCIIGCERNQVKPSVF